MSLLINRVILINHGPFVFHVHLDLSRFFLSISSYVKYRDIYEQLHRPRCFWYRSKSHLSLMANGWPWLGGITGNVDARATHEPQSTWSRSTGHCPLHILRRNSIAASKNHILCAKPRQLSRYRIFCTWYFMFVSTQTRSFCICLYNSNIILFLIT